MSLSAVQPLVQFGAERALNSIPAGLLIAAIAWLLLRLVGKQNSGTRFAVWFAALLAVAAIPFAAGHDRESSVSQLVHPQIMLPGSWALAIFAGWTLIAAVAACRLGCGLWNLRRLRRSCVPIVSSELPGSLWETVQNSGRTRAVTICRSSFVRVPTTIGFFKPAILLPEWASRELTAEELRVILLHELAHLRRWDDWTNLTQKMVRTIFFFHPAVWWIEKRLSLEREMACDDAVLAQTENPRAYAECLVSLAEKSFVRRGMAMAQAIISHARETSLRLARILDANRPSTARVFKPALGLMTAFASVCLVLLPHAPTLIGFEDAAQSPVRPAASSIVSLLAQAALVPVSAKITDSKTEPARPRISPAATVYRTNKAPQVVAVKHRLSRLPEAVLVRTNVKQVVPSQQFLVIMQSTQYDGRGSAVVNFCVWRVTFTTQSRNAVQQEVIQSKL